MLFTAPLITGCGGAGGCCCNAMFDGAQRASNAAAMLLKSNPRIEELFLNVDPFVPGAGISDGLDDAHVTDAVLETGPWSDAAF